MLPLEMQYSKHCLIQRKDDSPGNAYKKIRFTCYKTSHSSSETAVQTDIFAMC